MYKVVLFDFGGVIAEEGFREGLKAIALKNGIDPEEFYSYVTEYIYRCGYLTGKSSEELFWYGLKKQFGIGTDTETLRKEILDRFVLRKEILQLVQELKNRGHRTGILSDQTNWLDELNDRYHFFDLFDYVFNSYHIHMAKRQEVTFRYVIDEVKADPERIYFIDDNELNVQNAARAGINAILYTNYESLKKRLHEEGLL